MPFQFLICLSFGNQEKITEDEAKAGLKLSSHSLFVSYLFPFKLYLLSLQHIYLSISLCVFLSFFIINSLVNEFMERKRIGEE